MGLFPFAGTLASLNPSRVYAARGRWPGAFWWRCIMTMPPRSRSVPAFSRSAPSRLKTPRIQQASLSRKSSSAMNALRRWMIPALERGPPSGGIRWSLAL